MELAAVIKAFCSIFDVLHCSFDNAFLVRGMVVMFESKEPTSHWVPSTAISRNWMFSINIYQFWDKPTATNMFLSLDMFSARISLIFDSIVTHTQMYSESTWITISSMINSVILFRFFYNIFWGLYFWIHFQIETWFRLTICRNDKALATFRVDKPTKYKYRACLMSFEDVLFLLLIVWKIGHLQAISFS